MATGHAAAAREGRLVLTEGSWSRRATSGADRLRHHARVLADLVMRPKPDHQGHCTDRMNAALPYGDGLTPDEAVALVEANPGDGRGSSGCATSSGR